MGADMIREQEITDNPHAPYSRQDVLAMIPAFNEDRFIGSVVLKTLQYAAHVIVVDDGSRDQTAAVARTGRRPGDSS